MQWIFPAALLASLMVISPAVAGQDKTVASQGQVAAYRQDLTRAGTDKATPALKPELRRRAEAVRGRERLLERDPEEIIPDICIGC